MFARKHMPALIKSAPAFHSGDYATALKTAFLRVDELLRTKEGRKELAKISAQVCKAPVLYSRPKDEDIAGNVGCTACVALVSRTEVYVANAGDSRCVISKAGKAVPMSEDHKPELGREQKRILAAGGCVEDGRVRGVLNLSRSLGDLEFKANKKLPAEQQMITADPEIHVEKIFPETELLILGCDGVWDCYTSQKAVTTLRGELWDQDGPMKVGIGKVLANLLDAVLAKDLTSEGSLSA